jgi:PAS domain-containing protein
MLTIADRPLALRTQLAALPATWECNLADESLRWSPGVFDLFDLPRGCAINRAAALRHYTPASLAELQQLRETAIETGGSFTFEAELIRADGSSRWIRISADVLTTGGRATHLYGCKQDITAEMTARRVV